MQTNSKADLGHCQGERAKTKTFERYMIDLRKISAVKHVALFRGMG
jgi:hypothetical protein